MGRGIDFSKLDGYNKAPTQSFIMPDMATLYIKLGWEPPAEFINTVMNGKLVEADRSGTRGWHQCEYISEQQAASMGIADRELRSSGDITLSFEAPANSSATIGYLGGPSQNPLPLKMSNRLPTGFLEKLEGYMEQAKQAERQRWASYDSPSPQQTPQPKQQPGREEDGPRFSRGIRFDR